MKRLFSLLVMVLLSGWCLGQAFDNLQRPRNVVVYLGSGSNYYVGELMENNLKKVRYNLNFGMEYFVLPRISLRGELNFFRLSGSDALAKEGDDRRTRNLSFFSNNKELNLTGTFNLLPLPSRFDRRALLNIYGFTGLGLLWMNPKTKYDGKTYALAPLKTEGVTYQRFQPAIPLGLGIRIKYRMVNSLIIEGGYRFLGTDYLDDVSGIYYTGSQGLLTKGRYPDPATLDSDLSRALSDRRKEYDPNSNYQYNKGVRGNPTTKDGYFLINVRLDYYLHDAIFISRRVRQIMRYR